MYYTLMYWLSTIRVPLEQRGAHSINRSINRLNVLRRLRSPAVRQFFGFHYDLDFNAIDTFRRELNHDIECIGSSSTRIALTM